ncbi:helix-turn-helix domain-containing protein [Leisingera sp. McT4-56]|uniref:helix-turn-helix domain-containing protein n=1 Tax=Leisingera sp. McT4-56 TaxID=2881255 RepID=UPI001CF8FE0B|nr:helix-turn-helix transcriptional regulator [Leisingera sp. McT4-56]MCB4456877.1 helix-turn-helix domain-containing protein [Leisingera sp. McT4-56]
MIKNKLQYKVSISQLENFQEALKNASAMECPPEGTHPLMWKAQIEGMKSQITTLKREISEYEALASGEIQSIEVNSLEDFPKCLIMARISKGFTHKDLANLVGVKPQQIQRWEESDYYKTNFARLIEIADALEITISEKVSFQREAKTNAKALSDVGIDLNFLKRRFAVETSGEVHDVISRSADFLQKIWGIIVRPNGDLDLSGVNLNQAEFARFKVPKNADEKKVKAYAQYAYSVAATVSAVEETPISSTPSDWSEARKAILQRGDINLRNCLEYAWDLGVPVIPLSDPLRFHGCCWKVGGRNVIILKQSVRAESRWMFDLLHELHHASEQGINGTFAPNHLDGTSSERRESSEEMEANDFAGDVLLAGKAREYFDEVLKLSSHKIPFVKKNVEKVARKRQVNVGVLANYVAFRLKQDFDVDWWGAATNLQSDSDDAHSITQSVFRERFNFDALPEIDKRIIELAVAEPDL